MDEPDYDEIRRDFIAGMILSGLIASKYKPAYHTDHPTQEMIAEALKYTDKLIDQLDKDNER